MTNDILINLLAWCKRERENFKCSGKCCNQADFGFLRRRSQVKRTYRISTLSRLPPILPNWIAS